MKLFLPASALVTILCLGSSLNSSARVLDNFDDNTKTGWGDFTFNPLLGPSQEVDGQLHFEMPPAGQSIFIASQKTSETFELKEGRTLEFRVDVAQTGAKDSFAILAFIPNTGGNNPGTLAGYGLAKSTTDILMSKGINKYFVAEGWPGGLPNDNITLDLIITGKDGNAIITGRVLDKANNNAVIWERTVVDTPAADVLVGGAADSPAAPFFTTGYYTLYLYEDFSASAPENPYLVYYDNAEVYVQDTTVLDDFDDNTKTAWSDFTFNPLLGPSQEVDQQLHFEMPPAGQAIFIASQKISRTFELKEGDRVEFSVDVAQTGGKDSFAVLAFIPNTGGNNPGTLAGYGLSKSTTDILMSKGINKYFVAEGWPGGLPNDNITLDLIITGKDGNAIITGRVLDKANNNAVIWERTVVDTPAPDVLVGGAADSPAAPFFTTGYYTLYLYEDFSASAPENPYLVYYDNAIVLAPPVAANTAPLISDVSPGETDNFLPSATTKITFKVQDDKPLVNNTMSVTLNGTVYNTGNGLIVTGADKTRDVALGGLLVDNTDYTALLQVIDSDNATNSLVLHFDTFLPENLVIEIEDYNFDGGSFIDNPIPGMEGGPASPESYTLATGVAETDFHDTRGSPNGTNTKYRPSDAVRMQHTLDKPRQKFIDLGGGELQVFDYDVGDIVGGEWLNYTRTFPPGSYLVYLREANPNLPEGQIVECALEKVTGDPTQADATTTPVGSFLGGLTGFSYRNSSLTDGLGNKVILRLSGQETLRLRQVSSDPPGGAIYQNYLILVPTSDPGLQRAIVASVSPSRDTTVTTVSLSVSATIQNRDTEVKPSTIMFQFDGVDVTSMANIASDASGALVTYNVSPLPPPNTVHTARITFSDNFNVSQSSEWSFTLTYKFLDPANRASGPGIDAGFELRMAQADPSDPNLPRDNSLLQGENILAGRYLLVMDTNTTIQIVNQNKRLMQNSGLFPDDEVIPGLFDEDLNSFGNGDTDFAVEIVAWLDLAAGVHRFGGRTDDGFKCSSGASLHDLSSAGILGFWPDGPADQPERSNFEFVVIEAGLYPFRFMWYERQGAAYAEWYSMDLESGVPTLINDPNSETAIKAYRTVVNLTLQSAVLVNGPYANDATASHDAGAKQFTVPVSGASRFYRLRSDAPTRIKQIRIVEANAVITYE